MVNFDLGQPYHKCSCGLHFWNRDEWELLPLKGFQFTAPHEEVLELRNCHCRSTRSHELTTAEAAEWWAGAIKCLEDLSYYGTPIKPAKDTPNWRRLGYGEVWSLAYRNSEKDRARIRSMRQVVGL